MLHIRVVFQECHSPVGDLACAFNRGTFRQFEFHGEISLVFLGHEALRHEPVHKEYTHHQDAECGEHYARVYQRASHYLAIEAVAFGQAVVYGSEQLVACAVAAGFEHQRAHHGAEGEGYDCRDNNRYGDGDCELAVEHAGNSPQEAHRHKDGTQHKRHGNKRPAEVGHSLFGGFVR